MKKVIALLLAATLSLGLFAGCGQSAPSQSSAPATDAAANDSAVKDADASEASSDETAQTETVSFKKTKIAFATVGIDEDFVRLQEYLDKKLGPALNIEFVYSEELKDAGQMTAFIENAYAAGCEGVFTDSSGNLDQGAAVCNDLGMYFVGISSSGAVENQELPYYACVTGASAEGYGESYAEAMKSVLSDGEEHSVMILSAAACYGATSFLESAVGTLEALAEAYDLTYTEDVHTLASSNVQVDAENDKGIKITIVPGIGPTLTEAVSPMLQSGEYDVVVGTTDFYSTLGVAVDEVEKATGKNISFISRNAFTDTISSALNGQDSTGHPVLDAVVANGMYERLAAVIILRNCIDGYAEQMRDNGKCSRVPGMRPLVVTNAEDYNKLVSDEIPYCFLEIEELVNLCCAVNPNVTFADIDKVGSELTTEFILEKFY